MYRLQRPACLTAEQARGLGSKRHWWLRDSTGAFVKFGRWIEGCEDLDVEIALGVYTLGCGYPDGPGHRETIDLTAPPGVAPCARRGCDGVVAFAREVDLARCDPDEPEAARLCDGCK